jgi:hypothetical protein
VTTAFKVQSIFEGRVVELMKENPKGKTKKEIAAELDANTSEVNFAIACLVERRILYEYEENEAGESVYNFHPFV